MSEEKEKMEKKIPPVKSRSYLERLRIQLDRTDLDRGARELLESVYEAFLKQTKLLGGCVCHRNLVKDADQHATHCPVSRRPSEEEKEI